MKEIIKSEQPCEIIVKNLPYTCTEDELGDFFTDCGKINNVRFIRNSKTKLFKGFAYIEFKQSTSTYAAIKKNGLEFQGRKLIVDVNVS